MTEQATYEQWLKEVRTSLQSINMLFDDWQKIWPFDFNVEYDRGTEPGDAATNANRFWWYQQNKARGENCSKSADCWLPRGHQDDCQSV